MNKLTLKFALTATCSAMLALAATPAFGQETNPPAETDTLPPAPPPATNLEPQMEITGDTNIVIVVTPPPDAMVAETNVAPPTNALQPTGQTSGVRRDSFRKEDPNQRRKYSRDSSTQSPTQDRNNSNQDSRRTTAPDAQNSQGRPDFSNFKIIADRNIFDPNRRPSRTPGPRERPRSVESISLVGIMSYDKGTFAFFDGSSSAYRKALKQNDTIAGHRIESIDPNTVSLSSGTNKLELRVGMQMRREENGPWLASTQPATFATTSANSEGPLTASAPASTSSSSSPNVSEPGSSGGESDVLRRLRERREKE